jgi:hypothetical protein
MKRTLILSAILCLLVHLPGTSQELSSGLPIGTDCPAFDPYHVSGADKNSTACPMCKYGSRQGIMLWVNDDDWKALEPVLVRMEGEIQRRGLRNFRFFVMYMNPGKKPLDDAVKEATEEARRLKLRNVALTVIPSPDDRETAGLFRINPDSRVRNTVLVYKRRKVAYKKINLTQNGLNDLLNACDKLFAADPL